jgi:hypothetical protein
MYAIWNETGDMTTGIREIKNIIRESYKTPSVHMKKKKISLCYELASCWRTEQGPSLLHTWGST